MMFSLEAVVLYHEANVEDGIASTLASKTLLITCN